MDEKPTTLKAALRELTADEAREAGPHPGWKRLIAYREGILPAAERDALQEHLSLCPRCSGRLLELRTFARDATRSTSLLASRTFRGMAATLLFASVLSFGSLVVWRQSRHLAHLEDRLVERETELAAVRRELTATRLQLATAATAEPDPPSQVAERPPARTPAEAGRLSPALQAIAVTLVPRFTLRGQPPVDGELLRSDGSVHPVRGPSPGERVALLLAPITLPASGDVRVELVDGDGNVRWTTRRPAADLQGDAGASISLSGLGPGRYRLRWTGEGPGGDPLLGEHLFVVENE